MDISEKLEDVKGFLIIGVIGKKKKNKKVFWVEDFNFRIFYFFELDEIERGKLKFCYFVCNKGS